MKQQCLIFDLMKKKKKKKRYWLNERLDPFVAVSACMKQQGSFIATNYHLEVNKIPVMNRGWGWLIFIKLLQFGSLFELEVWQIRCWLSMK